MIGARRFFGFPSSIKARLARAIDSRPFETETEKAGCCRHPADRIA